MVISKVTWFRYFCLMLVLLIASCSNSVMDDSFVHENKNEIPGMVKIFADMQKVRLGSSDEKAPIKEKPQMVVTFDYDFYMGVSEVTCEEFNKVVQNVEGFNLQVPCSRSSLPAVHITYFDAVLFTNAKSKLQGFDTVYTYSERYFNSDGNCNELEGLNFHPEVLGYRLPTEAEWVFVASEDWNPQKGWHSSNSGYELHEICSAGKNKMGVCDIAGNAMEWTNDWLSNFRDTSVLDYVGNSDGGVLGERVVKGGSYRNEPNAIKISSRGDVYTVTSSTKSEYVGFRLALGSIPNATWLLAGQSLQTSRFIPLANASTLRTLTGTFLSKLAFRNDISGNLVFIDYASGSLSFHEIEDSIDVFHPDISPDGKKVAFCTGLEGVLGKSSLYVRDLNDQGSNLVKLDVENASIPRWRVSQNGDTNIVFVTSSILNKDASSWKQNSTWQVRFSNGKFGVKEKLFDGTYHGGVSDDNRLAVTGSSLFRVNVSGHDTLWYNGEQTCNVSLSKDGRHKTLFLDFGGKTGQTFVGEKYKEHARLLVVDSVGNLIQTVASPNHYAFDHTEWVVGGSTSGKPTNLAVATLTNINLAHTKIVAIDIEHNSIVNLIEGEELWHPCLWVKSNVLPENDYSLNIDSAGVYMDNSPTAGELVMKTKMRMFWDMKDSLELVVVGTSRTERGFDPSEIEDYVSLNMGYPGGDLLGELYLAENYVLNHVKNLKVLVLEISPDLQNNSPEFAYQVLYDAAPGYVYDRNHGFWVDGIPENFVKFVDANNSYSQTDLEGYVSGLGLLKADSMGWGIVSVEMDSNGTEQQMAYYNAAQDTLESFIERTLKRGIKIIAVVYPQSPRYENTGAFGRYGIRKSVVKESFARLERLSEKYPNFVFFDEYKFGRHDYTDKMALDYDHLSKYGATLFSKRLNSLLNTMK